MTEEILYREIKVRRIGTKRNFEFQTSKLLGMNISQSEIHDRIIHSKLIMGWDWKHQTIKKSGVKNNLKKF